MERQRSFGFKSTKFLLIFSFTISSSTLFLTIFSIWLFHDTLLLPPQPKLSPIKVRAFSTNFTVWEVQNSVLNDTLFTNPHNFSRNVVVDFGDRIQRNVSEVENGTFRSTHVKKIEVRGSESERNVNEGENGSLGSTHLVKIEGLGRESERNVSEGENGSLGSTHLEKIEGLGRESERNVSEVENGALGSTHLEQIEVLGREIERNVIELGTLGSTHLERIEVLGSESEINVSEVENGSLGSTHLEKIEVLGSESEGNVSEVENGTLGSTHLEKMEVLGNESERIEEKNSSDCDVWNGRWVYDESYPLYTNNTCSFIDEGFGCEGNGRKDRGYMKWRWQPYHCNIPRFDAVKMLELIRGKRIVFVGDSINRNQWESMLCLLKGAVKDPKRVYEIHGRKITKEKGNYSFKFLDYKCTVEYYVTHFLVHEGKGRVKQRRVSTLRIDAIDRGSSRWKGADILVFNTAHWWSHYKTKAGINYYQEGGQIHPKLDVSTAFRKAVTTWASWVDRHMTPGKTKIFFRSSSPSHFRGGQWNSGGHCKEGIQPLNNTSNALPSEKNLITEEIIKQMKTPVTLLNVTSLSEYRIDGHPSIYGRKPAKGPSSQDCSHWCLPGVPDTWNELLYFYLQSKQNTKSIE